MIEFDNFLKSENLEFDISEFDQAELFQALTLTNQVQAKSLLAYHKLINITEQAHQHDLDQKSEYLLENVSSKAQECFDNYLDKLDKSILIETIQKIKHIDSETKAQFHR